MSGGWAGRRPGVARRARLRLVGARCSWVWPVAGSRVGRARRADRRWWAVGSSDSSGERSANLGDEPSWMVEVVPADTDDVPSLRFEVALPLALAGE